MANVSMQEHLNVKIVRNMYWIRVSCFFFFYINFGFSVLRHTLTILHESALGFIHFASSGMFRFTILFTVGDICQFKCTIQIGEEFESALGVDIPMYIGFFVLVLASIPITHLCVNNNT